MEGCSSLSRKSSLNMANTMVDEEVIKRIRPTTKGLDRRGRVRLIVEDKVKTFNDNFEVFEYGSVPLRTFLPTADIDLIIIGDPTNLEDIKDHISRTDVKSRFKNVGILGNGTDVEFLRFNVGSIQVDLSINHTDGLAANIFMEMANRIFVRNNLFKESILLVKAWSSYEAKILGPGLLTSYSIQIMVMHVLKYLRGERVTPFEVLKRFLETYSQFDWDNFAVGRRGVININELNDLTAAYDGHPEFDSLNPCLQYCSTETNCGSFPTKGEFNQANMNIVDPINRFKNAAYKVNDSTKQSKIIYQLKKGHKKLRKLLAASSEEDLRGKVHNFFKNTMSKPIPTEDFLSMTVVDLSPQVQNFADARRIVHPKYRDLPSDIPPIPPAEPPPPIPL